MKSVLLFESYILSHLFRDQDELMTPQIRGCARAGDTRAPTTARALLFGIAGRLVNVVAHFCVPLGMLPLSASAGIAFKTKGGITRACSRPASAALRRAADAHR